MLMSSSTSSRLHVGSGHELSKSLLSHVIQMHSQIAIRINFIMLGRLAPIAWNPCDMKILPMLLASARTNVNNKISVRRLCKTCVAGEVLTRPSRGPAKLCLKCVNSLNLLQVFFCPQTVHVFRWNASRELVLR